MAEQPETKRKREDEAPACQRSPTWFQDGNIVLQAENIQYRVHRSVLASYSDIFRDLFTVPQPSPEFQETVEGCDLVHLPDSSEDITNLLLLLYDNFRVHTIRQPMTLSVITTMLQMGRKYHFKHFKAEAIQALKNEFPSDLKAFDDRKPFTSIQIETDFYVNIICLAHEYSINPILPAVFLLMVRRYSAEDICGSFERARNKDSLRWKEPDTCLSARDNLFTAIRRNFSWLKRLIPCLACKNEHVTLLHQLCSLDVLSTIQTATSPFSSTSLDKIGFCVSCKETARTAHDKARQRIWDKLPQYLKLDKATWELECEDLNEDRYIPA